MATESPFFAHTQCTASADYSQTGTALAGPNGTGQFLAVKMTTTPRQFVLCGAGDNTIGVLQNDPKIGQAGLIAFSGVTKFTAGAAVTVGDYLKIDSSGRAITGVVGTDKIAGVSLDGASGAGIVMTVQLMSTK